MIRRFVRVGPAGVIVAQDTGPGTWGVVRPSAGVFEITFPQLMTYDMTCFATVCDERINEVNSVPRFANVTRLRPEGVIVNTINGNNNSLAWYEFVLEIIGEPA